MDHWSERDSYVCVCLPLHVCMCVFMKLLNVMITRTVLSRTFPYVCTIPAYSGSIYFQLYLHFFKYTQIFILELGGLMALGSVLYAEEVGFLSICRCFLFRYYIWLGNVRKFAYRVRWSTASRRRMDLANVLFWKTFFGLQEPAQKESGRIPRGFWNHTRSIQNPSQKNFRTIHGGFCNHLKRNLEPSQKDSKTIAKGF